MPKAILYTAVTLDGYIADSNGGIDFLDHPLFRLPDEDYGYNAFYESVDAVIMGHNTFEKIKSFEGSYPYPDKHSVILSSKETLADGVSAGIVVSNDPADVALTSLTSKFETVWIVGGGATNAKLHRAGLIDEMILTYIPTTLGAGIPLFRSNESMANWKNIATKTYPNGLVQMHLAKA
ncbi:MAG: dihydrofolate reductase family protein [Bacteroidetes bacterium]|nr:dihydrofolate reductase family protein [Bacteroidota bacterium]MDA0897975.1 dihydrofolate reductase family protein [Bacteroidota bacterium]